MIRRAMLLLLAAMAMPAAAHAQDTSPKIAETAWRDIDFVPAGWKLFDKVEGDLNGDGREDSVLVIQRNDPALIIANPNGYGVENYDSNPRILLIALREADFQLRIVGRDDTIIPDWDNPNIDDPFDSIDIGGGGKVTLWIRYWASMGSWSMSNRQFHFRWDGEGMDLIGYDFIETHRATLDFTQTSINYLTGRRQDVEGNMDSGEDQESWSRIDKAAKPALGSIGNAFDFNP